MMTDENGFNSYFHALIFYEEINEAEIQKEDLDLVQNIWKKQHEGTIKRKKRDQGTVKEVLKKVRKNSFIYFC